MTLSLVPGPLCRALYVMVLKFLCLCFLSQEHQCCWQTGNYTKNEFIESMQTYGLTSDFYKICDYPVRKFSEHQVLPLKTALSSADHSILI